jgi:hypothetical protein
MRPISLARCLIAALRLLPNIQWTPIFLDQSNRRSSTRLTGKSSRPAQSRNVMLATRILVAAINRISEPSKLLKTCSIGTLAVPEHPTRS